MDVVRAWQEAVNQRDSTRLMRLSAPQVEVVGPRGSAVGRHVLQEWLERAGLSLGTLRIFARGNVVVVEQRGVWRATGTGEVTGDAILASAFRVDTDHRVDRFARYDDLSSALEDAGLGLNDELRPA